MVCFHRFFFFYIVTKNYHGKTIFPAELKLKQQMAKTVSGAHVLTDQCSSNLPQIPLNVHGQALRAKEKWETFGRSKYCDMSNIRNHDIT